MYIKYIYIKKWKQDINKAPAPYIMPVKPKYYTRASHLHRKHKAPDKKETRKLTESFPGRFLVGDLCFDSDLCLTLSFSLSLSLSFLSFSRSMSDSGESCVNKEKILNILNIYF